LGLVAFALGWRDRRIVQGAVLGAIGVAVVSVAIVGTGGVAGFVHLVALSSTQFAPSAFVGIYGLTGVILGNGAPGEILWLAGAVAACVIAWLAGAAVRSDRSRLEVGLTVAALATILATPHAYVHDLVLLAPMFEWPTPASGTRLRSGRQGARPSWFSRAGSLSPLPNFSASMADRSRRCSVARSPQAQSSLRCSLRSRLWPAW
jgi:hypothetical protein